jgi:ABC-type bacteriocin/lantibiotic exporter with double-glycine peptidase domain
VRPLVTLVAQRHEADCGVACLAMFLGVSYEDALLAIGGETPTVLRSGVYWKHLKRAAERLGVRLVLKRNWTLEDDGIVEVKHKKDPHVVVLRRGLIFETNLKVWSFSDYYAAPPRAKLGSMLVRED